MTVTTGAQIDDQTQGKAGSEPDEAYEGDVPFALRVVPAGLVS
ncbi:MAG: hypothetical protein ACRDWV_09940 [Acidimicrobiales bacterium]